MLVLPVNCKNINPVESFIFGSDFGNEILIRGKEQMAQIVALIKGFGLFIKYDVIIFIN